MKLKYYLRGLGTGIFVTALVLSIAFHVRIAKIQSTDRKIAENVTKSTQDKNREETTVSEKALESSSETTAEKFSDNEAVTLDTTTTAEETTPQPQTTASFEETTTAPQYDTVTLNIYSGMSSNKVAARLQELGVVEDADDFNNFMYANRVENNIHTGSFVISKNATYAEIVNIIAS